MDSYIVRHFFETQCYIIMEAVGLPFT